MNNGSQKPKILIFSLAYAPFIGGAEIAVQEITKRLGPPTGGFEFDLICARMDKKLAKKEKIGNVNVYRMGFGFKNFDKYIFTFFGFFKAWVLYRKNHYQIIWPIMAAYSSFAVLFKILTKAKVVLTLQEGDPLEYITGLKRFKIFRPIYKLLYFRKVDKVQAISNFLANWAKDLGVKEEKIAVVPNGIDLSGIRNREVGNRNEKIILTISRLVEKNGIEYLIKAFAQLIKLSDYPPIRRTGQIIKLLIVGSGPLENELKNLAKNLGVEDKVFFTGKVPYEDLGEYYATADVFCRPSLSEGLGNVFLEAMAASVPVIATPVGGIPDFLTDDSLSASVPQQPINTPADKLRIFNFLRFKKTGVYSPERQATDSERRRINSDQTGWFCEPKNPKSIAEKIEYVLSEENAAEVQKVVTNAKKMVEEKYTWQKVAEQMKEIFNELL